MQVNQHGGDIFQTMHDTESMQTGLSLVEMPKKTLPPEVLEYFRKQGKRGGKKGARIVADSMTPEQRSARAKKAADARWKKEPPSPSRP
jgi:hypothetical protein